MPRRPLCCASWCDMADMKTYDIYDFEPIRRYVRLNGEKRVYARGEKFCGMDDKSKLFAEVVSGAFSFSRPDYKGDEQIFSFAFDGEFIGSIISMPGQRSGFDIKAQCRSEVLVVDASEFKGYIDSEFLPDAVAMMNYAIAYGFMLRGISFRCDSPEIRYCKLLARVPGLEDRISKTTIASYLGVSREHFARIRSKMQRKNQQV